MASPAPADNQVIWHHIPNQAEDLPPPPGSLSLQAGMVSGDGRYDALPIEVNGHEITATLNINSPADDLLEGAFYVEVFNDHGSQKYHFNFQKYMVSFLFKRKAKKLQKAPKSKNFLYWKKPHLVTKPGILKSTNQQVCSVFRRKPLIHMNHMKKNQWIPCQVEPLLPSW